MACKCQSSGKSRRKCSCVKGNYSDDQPRADDGKWTGGGGGGGSSGGASSGGGSILSTLAKGALIAAGVATGVSLGAVAAPIAVTAAAALTGDVIVSALASSALAMGPSAAAAFGNLATGGAAATAGQLGGGTLGGLATYYGVKGGSLTPEAADAIAKRIPRANAAGDVPEYLMDLGPLMEAIAKGDPAKAVSILLDYKEKYGDDPEVVDALKAIAAEEGGSVKGHSIRASSKLRPNEIKRDLYEGKQVIRVPVVMARSDVVMNGSMVPKEELMPETWDGVPVTWGHPADSEGFVSANSPEVLSDWSIGRVFNSRMDGSSLKGEAWIEVERARKVAPGFVETLLSTKGELPIDVSTGYFSRDEKTSGELNGRSYEMVNRDLKPNHLAILVGEEGACSWEDGCGLRSNSKRTQMTKLAKLNRKDQAALDHVQSLIKSGRVDKTDTMLTLFVNERGNEDDRRQIMADLISREESPYTPEDEQSLMTMSEPTLRRMRDTYLAKDPAAEEVPPKEGEGEEITDNTDVEKEDEMLKDNAAALPKTMGELTGVITKVVSAALKGNSRPAVNVKDLAKELAPLIITDDMKAAMTFATNQVKQKRDGLIAHIVANSAITKAAAEAMNDATLEVVAAGILPRPSYAGASFSTNEVADEDDPAVAAMSAHMNIRDELAEARQKKRA